MSISSWLYIKDIHQYSRGKILIDPLEMKRELRAFWQELQMIATFDIVWEPPSARGRMCSTVAAESATFREFSAGPDGVRTKSHPITGQIVPTISVRRIFICLVIDLRLIILHRMIHSSLDPTNRVRQGSQYRRIRPLGASIPGGKMRMYLPIGTLDQTKLFFSLTIFILFSQ